MNMHTNPAIGAVYTASQIKRRRSTRAEVEARRAALYDIVGAQKPMTVRQAFYRASVLGLVDKTESGYDKVQYDLVLMRKSGVLPYGWITDGTRMMRKPRTHNSVAEALEDTAALYRKALWRDVNAYVEIWLEKDALSGVIWPITSKFDVPLMVARGYSSLTFAHEAAEYIADLDVPTFIYHLGDFDPSGVNAAEDIERKLRAGAPNAEIHFERLALTHEQITRWELPTRPTKLTDSRSKGFGNISVELDAVDPDQLRTLVELAIQRHLPRHEYRQLMVAEESERQLIGGLVGMALARSGRPGAPA